MKRYLSTAAIFACLVGGPMLVGCDRTVEQQKTTEQKSNGETETQEKKVTESPNGTMTTTTHEHMSNPTTNPNQ